MDGRETRKPTVNRRNLLSVITTVNVDDKANQVAKVDDHRRSVLPEPVVNLWVFHDNKAKAIYALSGRAYMIHGSESERAGILRKLAPIEDCCGATRSGVLMDGASCTALGELFLKTSLCRRSERRWSARQFR
jgi:hypothetical protein